MAASTPKLTIAKWVRVLDMQVTLHDKRTVMQGMVGYQLWRLDDVTSKVVLHRNMSLNESEEYKKTFIGSGVGECPSGRWFTKVQTKNFIGYHSACDKEPHSTHELFTYREDSNEVTFVVAKAEKKYTHESLTFNDTIACEVNSKWKTRLKEEMDARSDAYVLSNGCQKCGDNKSDYFWEYASGVVIHRSLYIDDMVFSCGCKTEIWVTKGFLDKAKRNVLGMEIFRDRSGNTLRVSQSSREYHGVCTRPGITSTDVGMLDRFDHGLETNVQVFVDFTMSWEDRSLSWKD
nr:zinc finger, CCHC-type [Tanacetum cinerariifolium]